MVALYLGSVDLGKFVGAGARKLWQPADVALDPDVGMYTLMFVGCAMRCGQPLFRGTCLKQFAQNSRVRLGIVGKKEKKTITGLLENTGGTLIR